MNEVRNRPPAVISHADWSSSAAKRWEATATWTGRCYEIGPPARVVDARRLVSGALERMNDVPALLGFDFPIGLPAAYAQAAGIDRFPEFLRDLGTDAWRDFFSVAAEPDEISLHRPFYPARPGQSRQQHLLDGLGLASKEQLLRRCERQTHDRPAASPLFWTLGAKQVGKAAISGWREVLVPAVADHPTSVAVWPFDGGLVELLSQARCVLAETYPAEACLHVGLGQPGKGWSKRNSAHRVAKGALIRQWAERRGVRLHERLVAWMNDGFGPDPEGEDPFDAVVGLCSMLEIVLGYRTDGAPVDRAVRAIEGWILGQVEPVPPLQ